MSAVAEISTPSGVRGWSLTHVLGLLMAAIAVLALLHVAVLLYHLQATIRFPYDLDYGEGYVLNDAMRLASGQPIYVNLSEFPMVRSPYPPLFPWLWSLVIPVVGPVFWPGRALAAIGLVGIAALVLWHGRRAGSAWGSIVAAAVVVGSPLVYQWAGYARVDTLAVLFAVGAVVAAQHLTGWRRALIPGLLCLLALWTKQTMVAAPLAIGLALTLRHPRSGAAFGAIVLVPSALLALTLNVASGGEFARHVLFGNASNPFNLAVLVISLAVFLGLHLPLVAGGLWGARPVMRQPITPLALYVPLTLLVSLSVGNEGSSVNYFLEPIAATALAVPYAWEAASHSAPLLAPVLAIIQLALLVHLPNGVGTQYLAVAPHGRTPTDGDWQAGALVDAAVQAEPGGVISEPAGFAVRSGRPVLVQPIDLRAEEYHQRWTGARLEQALTDGEIGSVVTTYNLLPCVAERILATRYRVEQVISSPDGLSFRLLPAGEGGDSGWAALPSESHMRRVRVVDTTTGEVLAEQAELADNIWTRFWGLMGRRSIEPGGGLVLKPGGGIHMFFMRIPLDVLHVDRRGRVTHVLRGIKPWRMGPLFVGGALAVELPTNAAARVQPGHEVVVRL